MLKRMIVLLLSINLLLTACATALEEPSNPSDPSWQALPVSAVLALDFENTTADAVHPEESLSLHGISVFTEGVSGQALGLDGSSYLELPNAAQRLSGQMSLSCWVKSEAPLEGNQPLLWFFPDQQQAGPGWSLTSPNDQTPLELTIGTTGGKPVKLFLSGSRSQFFPQGEWVHIAVVCDNQKGSALLYRNGLIQGQLSLPEDMALNPGENVIGLLGRNGSGNHIHICLDQLQLHNAALTSGQIVDLYTAYGASFDGNLVVQTDCEELVFSMRHLRQDIKLPTQGRLGSSISWRSDREALLTSDGYVTRPDSGLADETVTLTATVQYAGFVQEQDFVFTVEALPEYTDFSGFPPGDVQLLDIYEANTLKLALKTLNTLDADKLLWDYSANRITPYGQPQDAALRSNTLGHMLTALSQQYLATKNPLAQQQLAHILGQLAESQDASGYLAPFPEEVFDQLESGESRKDYWEAISHLLSGLLDVWELTGNQAALEIASGMGSWAYTRTAAWTVDIQARILSTRHAGMNQMLYRLYRHTGEENHLSAAHSFDDMALLDALVAGKDALSGRNVADTTAQMLGAACRYDLTKEEFYLRAAENYWDMVVDHHSYITGGLGVSGVFGDPQDLNVNRGTENSDLCSTWQMLRLTQLLFRLTGDSKYADYYENAYLNALLPAQHPQTGLVSPYQSMVSGLANQYLTQEDVLHCCAGTALEAFTAITDSIYFTQGDSLYILRYVPSQVEFGGLTLTQQTGMPLENIVRLRITGNGSTDLVLHIPSWCKNTPAVWINSQQVEATVVNGFLRLSRDWKNGDIIELTLPMELQAETLHGADNLIAFRYGPMVLSAELGTEGVHPDPGTDVLTVTQGTAQQWLDQAAIYLDMEEGYPRLILQGTDQILQFSPYYLLNPQRLGIYYYITEK